MSDVYEPIPVERRPYEWAYREMTTNFKNPDRYRVTKLDELAFSPNVHMAIFHSEDGDRPDIWRVYWSDRDLVKYDILVNYHSLKKEFPEIVGFLERNGVEAYNYEMKKREKTIEENGEAPYYYPQFPYYVINHRLIPELIGSCVTCSGISGKITDAKLLKHDCELVTIELDDGGTKQFIYPCDFLDGMISFTESIDQQKIESEMDYVWDEDKLTSAYRLREAWQRGLI